MRSGSAGTCQATYAWTSTRRPSRVPTSCRPLEVVRSRRSTSMVLSIGAGIFQARPGLVRTLIGSPKRVTTIAWPGPTSTRQALSTAAATIRKATTKRP